MVKIIVAEDDLNIRQYLVRTLKSKGYKVKEAGDGKEALDLINSGYVPDILTTDINMPRMNGYELIRELSKKGYSFPILIITTDWEKVSVDEYKGNTEYMSKSSIILSGSKLEEKVEELIQN